jgi:hypothetical protein
MLRRNETRGERRQHLRDQRRDRRNAPENVVVSSTVRWIAATLAGLRIKRLENPHGTLVKDERTTSGLLTGVDLSQNDVVVAGLVNRRHPATHLGRGTLQQRKPVGAEGHGQIFEAVLVLSGETRGKIPLMLAQNVHGEETAFPNGHSCRAAFVRTEEKHARLQ